MFRVVAFGVQARHRWAEGAHRHAKDRGVKRLEDAPSFLAHGGELARLIASFDWRATPLGPIDDWPASRKAAVSMMLCVQVPMVSLWGEQGVMIYNDAYVPIAAGRHPQGLGATVREGWPEVADFNDHVMKQVLAGRSLTFTDQELTLLRTGRPEQVWMSLDYSPILGEEGSPVGVLAIVIETTAKVRAERHVQGERERLRLMFDQAPGFMAVLSGPEHVIDMVNPAFMRLVGERDIVGKPVRAALPELDPQGFAARLVGAFSSGSAVSLRALPVALRRSAGGATEKRFVDVVVQPLLDDEGGVVSLFIQGSDVTDRVHAEEAARLQDEQFRTFAEAMPSQVWAATPSGRLDWLNNHLSVYSGLDDSALFARGWSALVHPQDAHLATTRWEQARALGIPYETELRLRRKDGTYRWHISRAVPLRSDAGQVVRWIGTNTDIEEQKQAAAVLGNMNSVLNRQLAARTADRDRTWQLSTDLMLVADHETRIVSVNPAWTTLLGWAQAELTGRSVMEFVHPDDREATLAEAAGLAAGVTTVRFENRYRRRDGSYCRLSWAAVPDEHFVHAVGRDVTADREAADALKRTEAALYQAQKMESVGQLTGGVAHDFNNLLQVISANLQLLSRRLGGDERSEKYVASALAGVRRGARLSSQLLAFARRQPLQPRVVGVGRLVCAMEELLRRTIGESIEIETVVADGLWDCLADPAQVENALLNLALNARDAMDGRGRLTIEAGNVSFDEAEVSDQPELGAGHYVVLTVTDTGAGIPADIIGQVFEPFFSTKPDGKGTGLGLSMVYGFVKQSGGHIRICSEVGQGTAVKIYLPRAVPSMSGGEGLTPARDTAAVEGGAETILVAEDDDAVRAAAVEMLRQLGYGVIETRDADAALGIVHSGAHIDLLFTDVVMPGSLRSPELARLAKMRLPQLAVLFTSGYTQDAIVHGGRLDAGVELLGKPYSQEALARHVRRLLSARV